MITIRVEGVEKTNRYLTDVERRQIPFATSVALNKTVEDMQRAVTGDISEVFDRPKPYTVKGTYIVKSDRRKVGDLQAEVGLKSRSRGTPVDEYLDANIDGGGRVDKRSEILLKRAGILPEGYQTRPGSGAKLDAWGNMSRGQIVQILSYFKAFGSIKTSGRFGAGRKTASAKLNRGAKKPIVQYFIVPDGYVGLATGIWRRHGRRPPEPILIFIKDASYRKRFDFYGKAIAAANRNWNANFSAAFNLAMRTAR